MELQKDQKRKRPICAFSLAAGTKAELDRYSKMTSIPRSRLIEQALKIAFDIGDKRND